MNSHKGIIISFKFWFIFLHFLLDLDSYLKKTNSTSHQNSEAMRVLYHVNILSLKSLQSLFTRLHFTVSCMVSS